MEACASFETVRGEIKKRLLPIDCEKECETCGFNPAEQVRRLSTGEFKPVHTRRGWNEGEGWHEVVLPEGTRQLVFAKKEEAAVGT